MSNPVDEARRFAAFKEWYAGAHERARARFDAFEAGAEFVRQEERSRYEGLLAAAEHWKAMFVPEGRSDGNFWDEEGEPTAVHHEREIDLLTAIAALSPTSSPTVDTCATCGEPATQLVNVNAAMNWTAPTKMEPRCAAHGLPFRSSNSAAEEEQL